MEQQLTVDVASYVGPTLDTGLFTMSATLAPGISHAQVEETIWHEIERIQHTGVDPAEVERAIKQTKAQFVFSSESVTYEAYWIGFSEVVASLDWLNTWIEQLSAVTPDDVQRVARQYFARHLQTVGWYVPEGECP